MMQSLTFCHSAEQPSSFYRNVMLSDSMGCVALNFVSKAKVPGKIFQIGLM